MIEEQLFIKDLRMIELEIPGLDVALFSLPMKASFLRVHTSPLLDCQNSHGQGLRIRRPKALDSTVLPSLQILTLTFSLRHRQNRFWGERSQYLFLDKDQLEGPN